MDVDSVSPVDGVTLHCADSLEWIPDLDPRTVIVTSLPDAAEVDMEVREWETWFVEAVRNVLTITPRGNPVVLFQTDRRWEGTTRSKAWLVFRALGGHWDPWDVVWHKVVLRRDAGKIDLRRPTYSHLFAVARSGDGVRPGTATADVIPPSPQIYRDGMPWAAARVAIDYAATYADVILDPFCGRGTVLLAAHDAGLRSIGIDVDPDAIGHAVDAFADHAGATTPAV